MTCEEVRDQLSAFLDGELEVLQRRRVEEHLAGCAACRAAVRALEEIIAAVHDAPWVADDVLPTEQILARLPSVARQRARAINRVSLEAAGAGLLGVGVACWVGVSLSPVRVLLHLLVALGGLLARLVLGGPPPWAVPCIVVLVSCLLGVDARAASPADPQGPGVEVGAEQTVQDVIAFGVPVHIAGTVTDTVIVIGGDLTLAETARIRRDVYVLGGTVVSAPSARIGGSVTVISPAVVSTLAAMRGPGSMLLGILLLVRLGLFFVVGALAWQLAPTVCVARQVRRLTARPLRVLGLGLLWATGLGIAAGVASLTLIGLPLGVLLLGLLAGASALGLAVALAWFRHLEHVPIGGRRVVIIPLVGLSLCPLVGEAILYAAGAVGLGVTLAAVAEARGTRLAALQAGR